jgi:hypothetical protein
VLAQQQRGDQEPRDDEEHIDADEAARQQRGKRMKRDHGDHRYGAKTVDIGAILL